MLGLSELKQTKVYQEAFAEGKEPTKLKAISNMIRLGLILEIMAQSLELPLDTVKKL